MKLHYDFTVRRYVQISYNSLMFWINFDLYHLIVALSLTGDNRVDSKTSSSPLIGFLPVSESVLRKHNYNGDRQLITRPPHRLIFIEISMRDNYPHCYSTRTPSTSQASAYQGTSSFCSSFRRIQ